MMEYCKAYHSKDNYCLKRMSCLWYLSSLRDKVKANDKFFEPPFEKEKEQSCKKYKNK
jgi:hypothetical protein